MGLECQEKTPESQEVSQMQWSPSRIGKISLKSHQLPTHYLDQVSIQHFGPHRVWLDAEALYSHPEKSIKTHKRETILDRSRMRWGINIDFLSKKVHIKINCMSLQAIRILYIIPMRIFEFRNPKLGSFVLNRGMEKSCTSVTFRKLFDSGLSLPIIFFFSQML